MNRLIFVILLVFFFSANAYGNNCARLTSREFHVESLSNSCQVLWGAQILNICDRPIELELEGALVNKKGYVLHKDRSRKIFLEPGESAKVSRRFATSCRLLLEVKALNYSTIVIKHSKGR
jgi:hypothetical protein